MTSSKKFGGIVIGFIILLFVLGLVKDGVIKTTVTATASNILGAPVHFDRLAVGVFRQSVRINGMKVYNPPGFSQDVLLDVPEISVDYDLGGMLSGKLHFPLIVFDLKELVVVKNKEGKLNVDSLKVTQKQERAVDKSSKEKASTQISMEIDVMTINIGKVVFKDYTKGDQPLIEVFDIHVKDKTYKNITSTQQVAVLVLAEALKPTAIKSAGVYAAAAILGTGLFPASVVGMFTGKDHAEAEFRITSQKLHEATLQILKKSGEIIQENKAQGFIKAKVDGADLNITIDPKTSGRSTIRISARKYLMSKPEIAAGILYQLQEKIK